MVVACERGINWHSTNANLILVDHFEEETIPEFNTEKRADKDEMKLPIY